MKELKFAKFDETVEIHVSLKLGKSQAVRDTVVLPNQFRGEKKVIVFCKEDRVQEALAAGATYAYQVAAVDADGLEGEKSDPTTATTKAAPRAPAGLVFRDLGGRIELALEDNPEADIDKYVVHQRSLMGSKPIGETLEPKFVVENAKPGKACTFTVVAVDRTGLQSAPSTPLKCTVAKPEGSVP